MFAFRRARRVIAACLIFCCTGCVCIGALAFIKNVVWPQASGGKVIQKGSLTVDASHTSDGYFMARSSNSSSKLKLRISRGDVTYTYDLNNAGEYEVFPLQMGSGEYTCSLYKNIKGNKYSKDAETRLKVGLDNEYASFLCANQYVNYSEDSPAVQMSYEICAGLEDDEDKLEAIRTFMKQGFTYDYVRALTTKGNYLGDVDGCFESRMGLCQDLAVIAACMLRVQGIPTQLVIGYAGDIYHAWNNVLIDGEYVRLDITRDLNGITGDPVYTAERFY